MRLEDCLNKEVNALCTRFGLSEDLRNKILDLAQRNRDEARRSSIRCLAAASVLYHIKRDSDCAGITTDDVASVADLGRFLLARVHRRLSFKTNSKPQICQLRPTPFVLSAVKRFNLSKTVRDKALMIDADLIRKGGVGGSPSSTAAAIIYLASLLMGEPIAQTKLIDHTVYLSAKAKKILGMLGLPDVDFRGSNRQRLLEPLNR